MQNLGLSLTHAGTLNIISEMCESFDKDVWQWKTEIERQEPRKTQNIKVNNDIIIIIYRCLYRRHHALIKRSY